MTPSGTAAWQTASVWSAAPASVGELGGTARRLRDWALRARRRPGPIAIVIRFSSFPAPGPRPHHRRVARALLQEVADRRDGEVIVADGDLLLFCRPEGDEPILLASLNRLLGTAPSGAPFETGDLIELWPAEQAPNRLLALATAIGPADTGDAHPNTDASGPGSTRELPSVLVRRMAALLTPGASPRPCLVEVGPWAIAPDDDGRRTLSALAEAVETGDPLDGIGAPPLQLRLGLRVLCAGAFAPIIRALRARRVTLVVGVAYAEACADPDGLAHARASLAALGVGFLLDGLDHLALRLTRPFALLGSMNSDLARITWSPSLSEPESRFDPTRTVLAHADDEAAIRWGLDRGISRFQGCHVDAMFGATRLRDCRFAADCTLGQCIERAGAADTAGRGLCRDPARLRGVAG